MALRFYEAVLSSAAFRVRIALALKGLPYESEVFDLRANTQRTEAYRRVNPLLTVPAIADGDFTLFESMAICEYLEETHPSPPLLPRAPADRARVRAMAQLVACDIHPLNNLRVLQYLGRELGIDEPRRDEWYRHWIRVGFDALEQQLAARAIGPYCLGHEPTLADVCLVPQVANANRLKVDLAPWPRIRAINDACLATKPFADARPEVQPDAE